MQDARAAAPSGSSSGAASQLERLPSAILTSILQLLPQAQRLHDCARVSTAWAALATAASTAVVVERIGGRVNRDARLAAFQAWLDQHGWQVESLAIKHHVYGAKPALRLHCARLARLHSVEAAAAVLSLEQDDNGDSGSVAGSAGSEAGRASSVLPALRSVTLSSCELSVASLAVLQSPQLMELRLDRVQLQPDPGAAPDDADARRRRWRSNVAKLLARQPGLKQLHLTTDASSDGFTFSSAFEVAIRGMQQLECLAVSGPGFPPAAVMRALPPAGSLTALDATFLRSQHSLTSQPGVQLSALQRLQLTGSAGNMCMYRLHPTALSSLSLLEHLSLRNAKLTSDVDVSEQDAATHGHRLFKAAAGTAQLMAVLSHLTRLQTLAIEGVDLVTLSVQQLEQFSALTASSQLRSLTLVDAEQGPEDVLHQLVLHHAFPAGRQLPELTALKFSADPGWRDMPPTWRVDAAGLTAVAAACSGLQELSLVGVLADQTDGAMARALAQLHQAPLTSLELDDWRGCLKDDAAAAVAQLTRLQHLSILGAPVLTDVGLLSLTQLTALTRLFVETAECGQLSEEVRFPDGRDGAAWGCACGMCSAGYDGDAEPIDLTGTAGRPVWRQLTACMAPSPLLTPACRQLRGELEEAQRMLAAREAEVQALQERQEGQAALEADLEDWEVALATRDVQLHEQGVRLAASEVQLRTCELELEARGLQLAVHQRAMQEWEVALAAREVQLQCQEVQLVAREVELQRKRVQLAAREAEMREWEVQLAAREAELHAISERLAALDV